MAAGTNYQKMVCYGYNANNNPIFQVAAKGFASDVTAAWDNDTATRLTVLGGGNVGIGTTNPSEKLEIADSSAPTIKINNTKNGAWTAGENFGGLEWYGNDTSGEGAGVKGYIKLDSINIYGAGFDMRFGTTDGTNGITERMVITYQGKVGIGTTDPASRLEVDGGDIEIDDSDRGLILRAPNGTRYRLKVANDGSLSTTAL